MVELPDHPWYLGCQFHPEYKSKPTDPHPLFVSYIAAALAERTRRDESEQHGLRDLRELRPERQPVAAGAAGGRAPASAAAGASLES